MKVIFFLSDICIPFLVCCILLYGWSRKLAVFHVFLDGAKRGMGIAADILPTLIGLLAAVQVLRDSGLLARLAEIFAPAAHLVRIPAEVIPLILIKLFSGSAATGMLLDLFEEYGPDSQVGFLAAVIVSSAETVLFVMSVYLNHIKAERSRWILPGALFSTFSGILAAVWITGILY